MRFLNNSQENVFFTPKYFRVKQNNIFPTVWSVPPELLKMYLCEICNQDSWINSLFTDTKALSPIIFLIKSAGKFREKISIFIMANYILNFFLSSEDRAANQIYFKYPNKRDCTVYNPQLLIPLLIRTRKLGIYIFWSKIKFHFFIANEPNC